MKLIIFTDLHYYGGDRATAIFGKHPGEIFANAGELIKLIEQSGKVKAAFSGHTHVPYLTSCKGVEYHVFGSPIATLMRGPQLRCATA